MDDHSNNNPNQQQQDKQAIAISLENSRFFDRDLVTNDECLDSVIDHLQSEILNDDSGAAVIKKPEWLRTHLMLVVTNLYLAHHHSIITNAFTGVWVAFSRDKNRYKRPPERYRTHRVSHRYFVEIVTNWMVDQVYIEFIPGFYNRVTGESKQSRMRAASKLVSLIEQQQSTPVSSSISSYPEMEVIILKGAADKGKPKPLQDYQDTDETIRMRNELAAYNEMIIAADIRINGVQITSKLDLRRIFNNGSFEEGGRYYGGAWQVASKADRKHMTINGDTAIELDYSGLHLRLLYNYYEGLECPDDPYDLTEYDYDLDLYRPLLKDAVLMMLNANTYQEARRAVQDKVNKTDTYKALQPDVPKLLKNVQDKHQALAKYFCSGIGTKLQRLDSQITEGILRGAVFHRAPVLPIHDSYMCSKKDGDLVTMLMEEVYRSMIKNLPVIKATTPLGEVTLKYYR